MKPEPSQSILKWLLWHPFKFAVIAFLLIMLTTIILNLAIPNVDNNWPITMAILISMACAAALTFWAMPRGNMDRRGFVALNNAQIFLTTTLFWIAAFLIAYAYQNQMVAKLALYGSINPNVFFSLIIFVGLFFMYLCGICLTNLYAKYQRCREMGLAPWQIILTIPFGLGLLWIPGYLMDDKNKSNSSVSVHTKWYSKLTDWIIATPTHVTASFVLITIYSGFFFGFRMTMLTMCSAIIFALWYRFAGLSAFRQHFKKTYTYVAIAVNILILIGVILFAATAPNNAVNIAMNISDIAPTSVQ